MKSNLINEFSTFLKLRLLNYSNNNDKNQENNELKEEKKEEIIEKIEIEKKEENEKKEEKQIENKGKNTNKKPVKKGENNNNKANNAANKNISYNYPKCTTNEQMERIAIVFGFISSLSVNEIHQNLLIELRNFYQIIFDQQNPLYLFFLHKISEYNFVSILQEDRSLFTFFLIILII